MTRINLIEPQNLTDQHLIAEYRELPRIFTAVRELVKNNKSIDDIVIPEHYVLGTGHMTFFYNKLEFLSERYNSIVQECFKRKLNIQFSQIDISDIPNCWKGNYEIESFSYCISKARILDRVLDKVHWYKYNKEPILQTILAEFYKLR